MPLFVHVEVDPEAAKQPDLVKKLVEVCPVNIFAQKPGGALEIVEANEDECTLCELCLDVLPGKDAVRVIKLYEDPPVSLTKKG